MDRLRTAARWERPCAGQRCSSSRRSSGFLSALLASFTLAASFLSSRLFCSFLSSFTLATSFFSSRLLCSFLSSFTLATSFFSSRLLSSLLCAFFSGALLRSRLLSCSFLGSRLLRCFAGYALFRCFFSGRLLRCYTLLSSRLFGRSFFLCCGTLFCFLLCFFSHGVLLQARTKGDSHRMVRTIHLRKRTCPQR
jgi:hypothetical protein